jgi:hypothetical protein
MWRISRRQILAISLAALLFRRAVRPIGALAAGAVEGRFSRGGKNGNESQAKNVKQDRGAGGEAKNKAAGMSGDRLARGKAAQSVGARSHLLADGKARATGGRDIGKTVTQRATSDPDLHPVRKYPLEAGLASEQNSHNENTQLDLEAALELLHRLNLYAGAGAGFRLMNPGNELVGELLEAKNALNFKESLPAAVHSARERATDLWTRPGGKAVIVITGSVGVVVVGGAAVLGAGTAAVGTGLWGTFLAGASAVGQVIGASSQAAGIAIAINQATLIGVRGTLTPWENIRRTAEHIETDFARYSTHMYLPHFSWAQY